MRKLNLFYSQKTWKGAKEHCSRTKGFSLVAIESKEEDRILHSFLKTEGIHYHWLSIL